MSNTILSLQPNHSAIVLDADGGGFLKLPDSSKGNLKEHEQILTIIFNNISDADWRQKFLTSQGANT